MLLVEDSISAPTPLRRRGSCGYRLRLHRSHHDEGGLSCGSVVAAPFVALVAGAESEPYAAAWSTSRRGPAKVCRLGAGYGPTTSLTRAIGLQIHLCRETIADREN